MNNMSIEFKPSNDFTGDNDELFHIHQGFCQSKNSAEHSCSETEIIFPNLLKSSELSRKVISWNSRSQPHFDKDTDCLFNDIPDLFHPVERQGIASDGMTSRPSNPVARVLEATEKNRNSEVSSFMKSSGNNRDDRFVLKFRDTKRKLSELYTGAE
mmetsp:Transcript_20249/g.22637  ORF Transcript_20249/g.22637 Transcript_20249/m.22637 type:complete len:156 (-) Transcript_20249:144-611(-)